MIRRSLGALALVAGASAAWACGPFRREATPGPGWSRGPAVPAPRGEVAVVATAQEIVVIGGLAGAGGATARVDVLHLRDGTWREGPALPHPLNHAAAAAAGHRVFVAGGSDQCGRPPRSDMLVLELPNGTRWQSVAPLPAGRWAGGMAAVAGRLIFAGGTGDAPQSTFAYDPVADRWERRAPLSAPREHLGVAAAGGLVFAVGGRWRGQNLATVEAYDPVADRWESLPPLPVARSGLGLAAVTSGERSALIAAGGEDPGLPGRVFPDAELFDLQARTWRALPPLPTPRHGLGGAGVGASAYFIAGSTQPGARSVLGWSGAVEIYRVT